MKSVFAGILASAFIAIYVPMAAKSETQNAQMVLKTVVIDAGHGGKDAGCVSKDKKTYEKNITLDVAKRLSTHIKESYPDVKVILTRDDDTFVELENRAKTANKASADLFISIHVNSVDGGTTANGYSIHCLGQSRKKGNDLYSKNLDLVKRENSVIMLEDNYQTTYQGFDPNDPQSSIIFNLMQNAHLGNSLAFAEDVAEAMGSHPIKNSRGVSQDPFWVLWRTAMPSVLIEIGFITNPDDLATMRSAEGREAIACNIFNAFSKFKSRYDGSMQVTAKPKPVPVIQEEKPAAAPPAPPVQKYGCQISVSTRLLSAGDPFFSGYRNIWVVQSGKYYKYYAEVSTSSDEAKASLANVRKKFPDAFVCELPKNAKSLK